MTRAVILDGGLATELEARGAKLNDDLWSAKLLAEKPGLIEQVHYDYLAAGADIVTSASYQATFQAFQRRGLSEENAADLMRLSVQLAQNACSRFWNEFSGQPNRQQPLVAASVGSYGAYLADGSEFRGDYGLSLGELMDFHRPRLAILANTPASLLACETIPCRMEGQALVHLLQEFPEAKAWLSFSCCNESQVRSGEFFQECVALANDSEQIVAVGLNCTSPMFVEPLLRLAGKVTSKPLLAYPNSGEEWDAERRSWLEGDPKADFGTLAVRWYEAGARLIGGCCRTIPEDIRRIAAALRS